MASTGVSDDAAIREQAYLFWEQEGRPDGREMEFWTRAKVAIAEKSQMDTLTKDAPKRGAKVAVKAKAEPAKASKAAASIAKAPVKSAAKTPAKADPKAKPKKK